MTSAAQHIALMTALGWEEVREYVFDLYAKAALAGFPRIDGVMCDELERVPPLSLDLLASAEATLTPKQRVAYVNQLGDLLGFDNDYYIPKESGGQRDYHLTSRAVAYFVSATKEQRLEAFLRVKHLWIEDAP